MTGDQTVAFRKASISSNNNKVLPCDCYDCSLIIDVGAELLLASAVLDV